MSTKLSKKQIQEYFKELSTFENQEVYYENEAMMLHFRVMQIVEEAMEKKDWNKKELSKRLGKSQSYITQLFMGSKMVNFLLLARLQDVLGFSFKLDSEFEDEKLCSWKLRKTLPSQNKAVRQKKVNKPDKTNGGIEPDLCAA